MLSVIYKATNIINGKCYIGFDSRWPNRQKEHIQQAFNRNQTKSNTVFHAAIRSYGPNSFTWEVLYSSEDKHHTLNVMESRFIQHHNTHHR